MKNIFEKCPKCPAFHLLTEKRKTKIDCWENKRDNQISRMKKIRLILLGESMPANRYFYDINTEYDGSGLRYTLQKEFGKFELSESLFLESMNRKGIVLYDCALCPLYKIEDNEQGKKNALRRRAATYCFLTINIHHISDKPGVPIVTIFPENLGYLKNEIPFEIKCRVKGEFTFSDQTGLSDLYEKIKALNP